MTTTMRKTFRLFISLIVALTSLVAAQPAAAVTNYTITVVATGGAAENSSWTYANGEIIPSATVSINAADIVAKLANGPLVLNADRILVNTSIVSSTANALTFKSTGNIIVGGGLTIQSQGGDLIFNSDSDANNTGHVRFGWDATCAMGYITSNGGDIVVGGGANPLTTATATQNNDPASTGCPGGTPPIAGVGFYNYTMNAGGGDISVRGGSPNLGALSTRAINIGGSGGLVPTFQTSGSGSISIYGDGSQITHNNAWGIATGAFNCTTVSGAITIEGRGNPSGPTNARGMSIGGAATLTSATGNISIIDRTSGALAGYTGINLGAAITVTTNGDFAVSADEITQGGALTLDVNNATIGAYSTSSFTAVYSTGVINAASSNSLRIGSPGNTSAITLSGAVTSGGPITVEAATVTINAALTASNSVVTLLTSGGVTQNSTITASTLNLAGTATYNAQTFTVSGGSAQVVFVATFESQGGSAVSSVVFASGGSFTLPSPPIYAGYEFIGWYATASGGTALESPYSPSGAANVTLYAQWIVEGTGAKIANWTTAVVQKGEVARISLIGSGLTSILNIESSSGSVRIASSTSERIDLEISGAEIGVGSISIRSTTQNATLAGLFKVVAAAAVKLATVSAKVQFAAGSSALSATEASALAASLKNVSTPVSVTVTGSVATSKATAATKALALKRAKAVAAVISAKFAGVNIQVAVAAAKGTSSANNNAVVTLKVAAKK